MYMDYESFYLIPSSIFAKKICLIFLAASLVAKNKTKTIIFSRAEIKFY